MVCISIKDEHKKEVPSNSKQYLLRVVYDSQDKNVHKLLEGIFGPDQMLDVRNGKIAKINSTLTPKERDCFLNMISEAMNKMEVEDDEEEIDNSEEDYDYEEENLEENKSASQESKDSKKVSAEKLIQEFASFLNSIS